jgi:pimeloyl-ACP methyl ester carboxylesterase
MRAREPDVDGYVEQGGVKIHYEAFGEGEPTLLLLPTWTIIHKRFLKAQIGYLDRHVRPVTHDGPGNGHSDRPEDPAAYRHATQLEYALAVLDATGTDRAVVAGLWQGSAWALGLQRYGAGRRLDYDEADPDHLADLIAQEIGRDVSYRPVATDGARRAASLLADLL